MYKDLAKNSISKDDWLNKGDSVLREVFDTIAHTELGDVFYARDLSSNLESLLFQLDDFSLIMKARDCLSKFPLLDGRMFLNLNNSIIEKDINDSRTLSIQTQTLSGINLNTSIS